MNEIFFALLPSTNDDNLLIKIHKKNNNFDVQVLGTPIQTIIDTEDRERFNDHIKNIGEQVAPSQAATNLERAIEAAESVCRWKSINQSLHRIKEVWLKRSFIKLRHGQKLGQRAGLNLHSCVYLTERRLHHKTSGDKSCSVR